MNIRGLANLGIRSVNKNIPVLWQTSTGYVTDAAGKRVSTFAQSTIQAQVQGISAGDMRHVDGLNIEGVKRAVIMYGNVQGVVRADQKGGDLLTFPEVPNGVSRSWRVVSIMETWPTWCKVIVVLQ
jgi:hypothetical protein